MGLEERGVQAAQRGPEEPVPLSVVLNNHAHQAPLLLQMLVTPDPTSWEFPAGGEGGRVWGQGGGWAEALAAAQPEGPGGREIAFPT